MHVPIEKIIRETERALLVKARIAWCSTVSASVDLWFPKSQIEKVGEREVIVTDWIARQKLDSLRRGGITPWFE